MALTKSGELLRSTRLKKELSLEDVERATKIRKKFLRSLEEGDVTIFHSLPYARGFLKNYAEFLGVDPKVALALFRRETEVQTPKIIPQGMVEGNASWLRITPARGIAVVMLFVVAAIVYYLFLEYRGFLGVPMLSLDKPGDQAIVQEDQIEVSGKADNDATVFINGEPITLEETGTFKKNIAVFEGEMTITVMAKNRRGKQTTVTRKIIVK